MIKEEVQEIIKENRNNKYVYELHSVESKPIEDVVECNSLMEAFNKIDSEYGLDWDNFTGLHIELLKGK
jgi:hypothetical protein